MSTAEELLSLVSMHTHPVPDTDTYFIIDPITRKIENTNRKKNVIMQYDHNSERFTFELPRYIDGHDMLECTSVTVNVDNIEVVESNSEETVEPRVNSDAPDITDLRVHPTDPEKVISSWLISRNSTQLAGILSFHIEYKCVDSEGNTVYEWSTDTYDEITVKARKKNGEAAVIPYSDALEQWRTRIFGAGDSVMANITAEGETQVAAVKAESETQQEAVELKGAQTLDTIPEDYTETNNMADEAVRSKGDAIVCEAAGESIVLKDSSDDYIRGLKLFGKSTQVTTTGKNLFDEQPRFGAYNDSTGEFIEKSHMLCSANPIVVVGGTRYYNCNNNTYPLYFFFYDSAGNFLSPRYAVGPGEYITAPTGAATMHVNISSSYGNVYNNDICIAMDKVLYEPYTGGKPSPNPDYPQEIVSVENPSIDIYGKNLWNHDYDNLDMSSISGWGNAIWNNDAVIKTLRPNTMYTLSFDVTALEVPEYETVFGDNCGFTLFSDKASGAYIVMAHTMDEGVFTVGEKRHVTGTFTTPANLLDTSMNYEILRYTQRLIPNEGDAVFATVKFENVQLELGNSATDYEPFIPAQTVGLSESIPGIPVTSGGNYTDSDGQQWICDEVDLERGVYVQRVYRLISDYATGWKISGNSTTDYNAFYRMNTSLPTMIKGTNRPVVCTHFTMTQNPIPDCTTCVSGGLSNQEVYFFVPKVKFPDVETWTNYVLQQTADGTPITTYYILATPIETPLTAEEIAAFKALRTNYPHTTILNDAGAWMSVKYNADTKTYVENPKTLKLVDSSTGVVYELKIVNGSLAVNPV